MIDKLIADTDACIKLGGSEKFCFLQTYVTTMEVVL